MAELLDTNQLYNIVGENIDAFRPIFEEFESNANDLLLKIKTARDTNNLNDLRAAAHQLKGTSSMLGMNQLYELSYSIENLNLTDITPAFMKKMQDTLKRSVQSARKALA